MKRILSPATNANGWLTLLAAAWAIASAVHHFSPQTQVYAWTIGAALTLLARQTVTPVKDPRDGNGNLLVAGTSAGTVLEAFSRETGVSPEDYRQAIQHATAERLALMQLPPVAVQLGDPERRRAEDLRLMFAPGSPSFYPYPGEQEAPSPSGSLPPAVQPPTTGSTTP